MPDDEAVIAIDCDVWQPKARVTIENEAIALFANAPHRKGNPEKVGTFLVRVKIQEGAKPVCYSKRQFEDA